MCKKCTSKKLCPVGERLERRLDAMERQYSRGTATREQWLAAKRAYAAHLRGK